MIELKCLFNQKQTSQLNAYLNQLLSSELIINLGVDHDTIQQVP